MATLLARVVLGALFAFYGGHKIADPIAFLKALHAYGVLPVSPPWWLNVTAVALPWVEVLCGACLLLGFWLRPAAWLAAALTTAFTAAVSFRALAVHHGTGAPLCSIDLDCGCGPWSTPFCLKLAENTVLTALALLVATRRSPAAAARPLPA